jgi:hypothetical protein
MCNHSAVTVGVRARCFRPIRLRALRSDAHRLEVSLGSPLRHLRREWVHTSHICTRTGLTPATTAPQLGSPQSHRHQRLAHPCHNSRRTGLTLATSAPGLGSPPPHLHRDWSRPCQLCPGTSCRRSSSVACAIAKFCGPTCSSSATIRTFVPRPRLRLPRSPIRASRAGQHGPGPFSNQLVPPPVTDRSAASCSGLCGVRPAAPAKIKWTGPDVHSWEWGHLPVGRTPAPC